eukprot:862689-Pleurochrysis_carterae.AAC.7
MERREMEGMSTQQLSVYLQNRRKTHYGKEKHAELVVTFDHAERAPSLLHHGINMSSSSIDTTLANKATPSAKKHINEVLRSYRQKWNFLKTKASATRVPLVMNRMPSLRPRPRACFANSCANMVQPKTM